MTKNEFKCWLEGYLDALVDEEDLLRITEKLDEVDFEYKQPINIYPDKNPWSPPWSPLYGNYEVKFDYTSPNSAGKMF